MAAADKASDGKAPAAAAGAAAPKWSAEFEKLIGNDFINNKGTKFTAADLKGKTFGIYFSAHWCPPCRGFTPELIKTYNKLKKEGKNFEVVFVSSDRDQKGFDEYFHEMPWLAIPFTDKTRNGNLSNADGVQGIPMLIIVDGNTGMTITKNGRAAVSGDKEGKEFPWEPQPATELTSSTVSDINEMPMLIAFLDQTGAEAATQASVTKAVTTVATEVYADSKKNGKDPPVQFRWAKGDRVVASVVGFAKLTPDTTLAIVDIPKREKYVSTAALSSLNEKAIRDFYEGFKAGTLAKAALAMPAADDDD